MYTNNNTTPFVIFVVYMCRGNLSPTLQALVRLRVSFMLNWCPWRVEGTVTCNGNEHGTNSCFVDCIWNLSTSGWWVLVAFNSSMPKIEHDWSISGIPFIITASWVSVKYLCANRKTYTRVCLFGAISVLGIYCKLSWLVLFMYPAKAELEIPIRI